MDDKYRKEIQKEFIDCVRKTIDRIVKSESSEGSYAPFHDALLPANTMKWSKFERSFSTSFGQRVVERISELAVLSNGATKTERQHKEEFELYENVLLQIDKEEKRIDSESNWKSSVSNVNDVKGTGKKIKIRVISDLYWEKDGIKHYASIKTVKPNIDQTGVAKKDCLKLIMNDPTCKPYYGLYYNPFGEEKIKYAHNPPNSIFDMQHDAVVLIGKEYWETLGGPGFYEDLLQIAKASGKITKPMIEQYARGEWIIS